MGTDAPDSDIQQLCSEPVIINNEYCSQCCLGEIPERSPLVCTTMAVIPPHLFFPPPVADINDPRAHYLDSEFEAWCYEWSLKKGIHYSMCTEGSIGMDPADLHLQQECAEIVFLFNKYYYEECLGRKFPGDLQDPNRKLGGGQEP